MQRTVRRNVERWKAQEMVLCNSDCNDMAYYICAYIKNYFIKTMCNFHIKV